MVLGAHAVAVDAKIRRLQEAVNALGRAKDDRQLMVATDGVLGARTIAAVNRAIAVYVVKGAGAKRIPQAWQRMTSSMVSANALALAREIENEAGYIPAAVAHDPPPQAFPAQQTSMIPSPGGAPAMNPTGYYPPQQPGYYPPGYAPQRAGGLPTDRATLDVKAFIPAQYEHISLTPAGGMVIVLVGVLGFLLISQHRKATK